MFNRNDFNTMFNQAQNQHARIRREIAAEQERDATILKVGAGLLFLGAAGYVAMRMREGVVPSHQELCYLLSSQNKFSVTHVGIMRRLGQACNFNVDAMMKAIEIPAMDVAAQEVSGYFPAAVLPAATQYSLQTVYPDASGQMLKSTMNLYPETGPVVYASARAATIRTFCRENVFPVLRQMFTDFVAFVKQGLTDAQIFGKMSAANYGADTTANVVLPAASVSAAKFATRMVPA